MVVAIQWATTAVMEIVISDKGTEVSVADILLSEECLACTAEVVSAVMGALEAMEEDMAQWEAVMPKTGQYLFMRNIFNQVCTRLTFDHSYHTFVHVRRFIQVAEESSRSAFQSIESVVNAVLNIAQMLESTYFALTSSFRAVLGVAANFGRLRGLFSQFWTSFALFRTFNWVFRK